jgi:thiamine monophosphate synthase
LPLVAIGGITLSNAAEVLKAGANAVAVIAELLANPAKIAENMSKILIATSHPANE